MSYEAFSLTLMLTHACNLRCTYCYTGSKVKRAMSERVAKAAVDRAINSVAPGGLLELGFFGGEPLIEARLITSIMAYAREQSRNRDLRLAGHLTTNGTIRDADAWRLLSDPELGISVSFDGLPAIHDRHRVDIDGKGSSGQVETLLKRLLSSGREITVVMVVRPDTAAMLPHGVQYLRTLGVRDIEPSIDLWTAWPDEDQERLHDALTECADLWRAALPNLSISWFDEKLARFAQIPIDECARCGFGDGQIAVAPSGSLYPCERLIGEDADGNPWRLPGHVLDKHRFDNLRPAAATLPSSCPAAPGTACRCSNFVRTGNSERADTLLRNLDRWCTEETVRVMGLAGTPLEEKHG